MKYMYLFDKTENLIYDFEAQLQAVSSFRREKINSYKLHDDKMLSLAATILLDELLKKTGRREADMKYYLNEYSKPFFKDNELFFSLSHSKDYALAVICDTEVGCDIQKSCDFNNNIAERFFTKAECEYIKSDTDFFRIWSMKESFIKAIGRGLSIPLNSFEISNYNSHAYVIYNNEKYEFEEKNINNDYFISICKKSRSL